MPRPEERTRITVEERRRRIAACPHDGRGCSIIDRRSEKVALYAPAVDARWKHATAGDCPCCGAWPGGACGTEWRHRKAGVPMRYGEFCPERLLAPNDQMSFKAALGIHDPEGVL